MTSPSFGVPQYPIIPLCSLQYLVPGKLVLITTAPVEEWEEGYLGVKAMMTRVGQEAFSSKISPAAPGIRPDNALFTNQLL